MLVIVYIFNFIDRNILSILSQDIQADLGVTDAQMGFLYGTVFAVFYAVFGIPLARFADVWVRRSLISAGLLVWSVMTAMSGFARSFPMLAVFRIGVGIGEASASPAAYSMLSDYYHPRLRATVLAIYSSGVYIGGGIGLFLGGSIMETWNGAYPDPGTSPLNLKGWQAAFPSIAFVTYGVGYWTAPLLLRLHDTSPGEVGMYIGLGSAVGGLIGVTMGGVTADWAKRKHPAGRLIIGFIAIFGTAPLVLWMIYTESLMTAFILNFAHHIFSASWPGIPPSTAADLVVPRMRAVAGAFFLLVNTMIGLAMGPYFMGQLSDVYRAGGMDRGESLQTAIATGLLIFVATFFLLILAWRHLPKDESTRLARAREQGEEV